MLAGYPLGEGVLGHNPNVDGKNIAKYSNSNIVLNADAT